MHPIEKIRLEHGIPFYLYAGSYARSLAPLLFASQPQPKEFIPD